MNERVTAGSAVVPTSATYSSTGAWSASAPPCSPLGLLAAALEAKLEPSFYWQDDFETVIGLGESEVIEASGPSRFSDVESALRLRAHQLPEAAARRWAGGFSFEDEVEGRFRSFGAMRFVQPRTSWRLRRSDAYATVEGLGGSRGERSTVVEWARTDWSAPEPLGPGGAEVAAGDRAAWDSAMAEAGAAFSTGAATKVVLSRDVVVRGPTSFSPARVLAALRPRSPSEAAFAFFAPDSTCFLGLSPERLVRVEGRNFFTEALAGTSKRGDPDGQDLLSSAKDREEHRWVVDHLRARLQKLSVEVQLEAEPSVRRLGALSHLCTLVQGRSVEPASVFALTRALHPTPAVGGVPPRAAQTVIRAAEGRSRGWYAGGVGWAQLTGDGGLDGDLRVALRSAHLAESEARVFVGAGIVPASTADAEWEETALKARRTLKALGVELP